MLLLITLLVAASGGFLLGAALHYPRGFQDGCSWEANHHDDPDLAEHRFVRTIPPEAESPEDFQS